MSLKLFLLSSFGGIKATSKIEAERESLLKDYQVFIRVGQSDELQEFLGLQEKVNSASFKKLKADLGAMKFKGSHEEGQLKQFNKLDRNKNLKNFYQTAASPELKRYETLRDGTQLDRYFELEKTIGTDLKNFAEKAKALKAEHKMLKSSSDARFFLKYPKSAVYKNYVQMQGSEEKKKYEELKSITGATAFKAKPDEAQMKQFHALDKNKKLKQYYQTAASSELKRYESLKDGAQLDRYFELEKTIGADLKNLDEKAKVLRAEYQSLKSSSDVRFFQTYPKSTAYKNYVRMSGSEEKRKYEALKEVVGSAEFQERKAYLEDDKKWEKTPEYLDEQRYLVLKNNPELVLYFKYKGTPAFDFFKQWEIIFEDRFDTEKLDPAKWKTTNYWAEKTVGRNFSQDGDLQAFADGKNIHLRGSALQIQVKRDKLNSIVWKPAVGFMEQEFGYSSDTLTTGGLFQAHYGILEAKVKFDPDKSFQDVFYLAGEDNSVRASLLESGAKVQFGTSQTASGKMVSDVFSLKGLSAGKTYIFRMEWEKDKILWKINGKEMFSVQSGVPDFPMFLNLASLVIAETNKLPHNFEVDWVRFYQRRKR